ncbi:MAG: hypothetical protein PHN49_03205 [Candidatus Omnitrophica bacterium]|nr:hypothetical protein [Candidatus Omnitrophota bacterium]MDD5670628.1 hypothetical protein [Candidatus Omnitrophota bacterium]
MTNESNTSLTARVGSIDEYQKETGEKLQTLAKDLDGWFEEMCAVHIALSGKLKTKSKKAPESKHQESVQAPVAAPVPVAQPAAEDYKAVIEKLLQGSIEALGDKLSGRIMAMLQELKTVSDPMRETKLKEIHEAAQSEHVDLARLFLYEKVESNLGKEGIQIDEKKSKGIGSILDKLKKLKEGQQ